MENYQNLIMELLVGETPKEKYENLKKLIDKKYIPEQIIETMEAISDTFKLMDKDVTKLIERAKL